MRTFDVLPRRARDKHTEISPQRWLAFSGQTKSDSHLEQCGGGRGLRRASSFDRKGGGGSLVERAKLRRSRSFQSGAARGGEQADGGEGYDEALLLEADEGYADELADESGESLEARMARLAPLVANIVDPQDDDGGNGSESGASSRRNSGASDASPLLNPLPGLARERGLE